MANPEQHVDRVGDLLEDDYVTVTEDSFVGIAIDQFREFAPKDDDSTIYYLYIVDAEDNLAGVMSLRELLNAPEDELVSEYMETDLFTIDADAHPEDAVALMQEVDFPAIPVVKDGKLEGIARSDDMLEVLEEEASEDILKSAGFTFADIETSRSQLILESSISQILRLRLPWLFIALGGGLMAGFVIEGFEEELGAVIALAFFLPVIMDMGGNVGTQASTIFVRGLALGHIDDRNAMQHFAREGLVGLLIGLIIGGLGAGVAYGWQGLWRGEAFAPELALTVFIGLVSVCVVASVIGYVIPWLANKFGYDPAAASDPLITTVKDVTALVIYFSIAAILLSDLM